MRSRLLRRLPEELAGPRVAAPHLDLSPPRDESARCGAGRASVARARAVSTDRCCQLANVRKSELANCRNLDLPTTWISSAAPLERASPARPGARSIACHSRAVASPRPYIAAAPAAKSKRTRGPVFEVCPETRPSQRSTTRVHLRPRGRCPARAALPQGSLASQGPRGSGRPRGGRTPCTRGGWGGVACCAAICRGPDANPQRLEISASSNPLPSTKSTKITHL